MGVGPLSDGVDTGMVRETLSSATQVTVRDQESRMVLEEAGLLNPITVTADPAFLLQPEEFPAHLLAEEGVPVGKRLVGISVREPGRAAERLDVDGYHRLLAQIGDFLVHRIDAYVLFVPMERDDIRHAHGVLSHMVAAERGRILHGTYSPQQVLGLMRHFDLAVGMRLHFLIFAAMVGTPFLPLPYAGKVFDLAQRLGVPALRGVEREVEGPLLAEVDRLWDEREQRAEATARRVAEVCEQARGTSEVTRGVLESLRSPVASPGSEPAVAPPSHRRAGPPVAPLAGLLVGGLQLVDLRVGQPTGAEVVVGQRRTAVAVQFDGDGLPVRRAADEKDLHGEAMRPSCPARVARSG